MFVEYFLSHRANEVSIISLTMGSKASSLSSVHEAIIQGKVSINSIRGDETLHSLDTVIEIADSIVEIPEKSISSKDKKMIVNIFNALGNEVGIPVYDPAVGTIVTACRLKVLSALMRFLSLSFISKQEFEQCFVRGLSNCLRLDDFDVVSLTICCIVKAVDCMDDDNDRMLLYYQLAGKGYFELLEEILSISERLLEFGAFKVSCAYPLLQACDQITWIMHPPELSGPASGIAMSLRNRVASTFMTAYRSLCALCMHKIQPISFAAILTTVNILSVISVYDAHQFQVSEYNSLLKVTYQEMNLDWIVWLVSGCCMR